MAASPSTGPRADQPATDPPPIAVAGGGAEGGATRSARLRRAVIAGHRGDREDARALVGDADPAVRAAALGALARLGEWDADLLERALADPDAGVRRRAVTIAGRRAARGTIGTFSASSDTAGPADRPEHTAGPADRPEHTAGPADRPEHTAGAGDADLARQGAALLAATADPDPGVAEAAAWAVGELPEPARPRRAVPVLAAVAGGHPDPLCREAAVAALGAIGDPGGLQAVLQALNGKPPLRRRAAVALAAFDDPRADQALHRCLADRDWQVREVAEELLGPGAGGAGLASAASDAGPDSAGPGPEPTAV